MDDEVKKSGRMNSPRMSNGKNPIIENMFRTYNYSE